jgi:hypothetical protein
VAGQKFESVRDAKEFLIQWIDVEARRVGTPLMAVERKMLYSSEKGWTLPDMAEIQDAFSRYHDLVEYEEKMGKLIRSIQASLRLNKEEYDAWTEAVRVLSREDHYLLQLIKGSGEIVRRRSRRLQLWVAAGLVTAFFVAIAYWINMHYLGDAQVYVPRVN